MSGIETIIECNDWRKSLADIEALATRVFMAAAAREPQLQGSAALLLTDNAAVRDLNARFRGIGAPTNVLSFPSHERAPGFLGDIALAFETCAREAGDKGVSLADHVAHLITHGLLHLVGYDHLEPAQSDIMERLEAEILDALSISNPYGGEESDD